jgi:enoyl-CoA hydratase
MAEGKETIILEKRGSAGWVFFSRPERMNALSPESIRGLWASLAKLEADPEVRVVVFTGQGEAFCAGMDMAGLEKSTPLAARRRSREIQMLTNRIADMSLPTIAAVNGVAMGAGMEICLACDMVFASSDARFAFPEIRLGMIPCGGGTQRLARLIGLRRARDMVFTGRILRADQAMQWGLVNEVVEAGELVEKVGDLVGKMSLGGRMALYQAKRCLNHSLDMDLNRGLEYETECFTTCFSSGEPAAGLKRFAAMATDEPPAGEPKEAKTAPAEPEKPAKVEERDEEKEPAGEVAEFEEEEPLQEDEVEDEDEGDIFE